MACELKKAIDFINNTKGMERIAKQVAAIIAKTSPTTSGIKWHDSANVIVDKDGNAQVTVNSIEELKQLAKDFNTLMRKRGMVNPDVMDSDEWFGDIYDDLANKVFGETNISLKFMERVNDETTDLATAVGDTIRVGTNVPFFADPMKVVLHELAHTVTVAKLADDKEAYARIEDIMAKAKEAGLDKDPKMHYAFTNPKEFLAEAISNPYLQSKLREVPSDGKNTLLDDVKNVFKRLLKRIKVTDLNNALGDTLDVVISIQGTKKPKVVVKVNNEETIASEAVPWDEEPVKSKVVKPKKKKAATGKDSLNEGQLKAHDQIVQFFASPITSEHVLDAAGGTGKTYTIGIVEETIKDFVGGKELKYIAPTHSAKNVLKASTGKDAMTLQSALGIKLNENTGKFEKAFDSEPKIRRGDWVVVDESSMITEALHDELMSAVGARGKVLFMGDSAQLPPIGDKHSISTTLQDREGVSKSSLTEVMRFDETSAIGPITTALRDNVLKGTDVNPLTLLDGKDSISDTGSVIYLDNTDDTIDAFVADFKENESTIIVTFNNQENNNPQSVKSLNIKVREQIQPDNMDTIIAEDIIVAYASMKIDENTEIANSARIKVVSADKKRKKTEVVKSTSRKLGKQSAKVEFEVQYAEVEVDGKLHEITIVTPEGKKQIKAAKEEYGPANPMFYKIEELYNTNLSSEFGYAVTSHKVQGASYDNVYVMADNIQGATMATQDARSKAMYVAMSRPKQKLVISSKYDFGVVKPKTSIKAAPKKAPTKATGIAVNDQKMLDSIANIDNVAARKGAIASAKRSFKGKPDVLAALTELESTSAYGETTAVLTNPAITLDTKHTQQKGEYIKETFADRFNAMFIGNEFSRGEAGMPFETKLFKLNRKSSEADKEFYDLIFPGIENVVKSIILKLVAEDKNIEKITDFRLEDDGRIEFVYHVLPEFADETGNVRQSMAVPMDTFDKMILGDAQLLQMARDIFDKGSNVYVSPLDSQADSGIITDKVVSPTAEKLDVDMDKAIAAEYAKALNKSNKCK